MLSWRKGEVFLFMRRKEDVVWVKSEWGGGERRVERVENGNRGGLEGKEEMGR
jgi:hypothetical protein